MKRRLDVCLVNVAAAVFFQEPSAVEEEKPVSVVSQKNAVANRCDTCQDEFSKTYDEDSEEWVYKGVIQMDGKVIMLI